MDITEMKVMCPADDWTCPYYDKDTGRCKMPQMEECDPHDECDEFLFEDDDEEEDEDL